MNIQSIDLNLFLVFQAIFATRSVTLAGERLGMTQSAVSNALKRMRERFNDVLFVRSAEGMVPTPLAERLIGPVEEGLAAFSQAVDQGRTFEAGTSGRLFRIAVNDIGQLVMMPRLLSLARGLAPGIRFETVDVPRAEARQRMLHGQIDVALGSWEPMGPSFYQQRLFDETFVVLVARASPLGTRDSIALDDYLAAEHIAYRPRGTTDHQLQQALERVGALDRRRVVLTAAHSLGLSSIVATTGLVLTAPQRLAQAMVASRSDLHILNAPFEVAPFEISQQWHERFHQDSGNRWLRELMFGLFHEKSRRAPEPGAGAVPDGLARVPSEPAD